MSYTAQQDAVLRMLTAKGVTLVMTRRSGGTHDPVAQTTTGAVTATQAVRAVVLPASESRDLTFEERSLVRRNQRKLYIAGKAPNGSALEFEPDRGVTVQFEGAMWTMGPSSRLAPDAGVPVLFTVEVKR